MKDIPKPFLEHLEELRLRLLKSIVAIGLGTLLCYQFVDRLLRFLAKPVGKFIFLEPTEAFFVRLKIALGLGVVAALPVVLFQLWKFVVVALNPSEKKSLYWIIPLSYILFLAGLAFGFFVLVPAGIQFLLQYGSDVLVANLSIERYVDFVATFCLVLGAVFQMPMVSFFLAKIGVLDHSMLADKRRIAIVVIYILSALLTPGPDPVTAFLLFVPTYVLYECSVWLAKLAAGGES